LATTAALDPATVREQDALVARPVAFADIPRSCWERLLSLTPAATPFARWAFHRAWWEAYGDTAHEQYLACLPGGAATGDGERLVWEQIRAIVPLMHRHEVEPDDIVNRSVLRHHEQPPVCRTVPADAKAIFFGASYHADYATILAAPADLPMVAVAVADSFVQPPDTTHGSQPWDVVDLRRLREDDPTLSALESALRAAPADWEVVRELEDVCPVISAPSSDWDEYLTTLDKKARHEIRRKLRRAATVGNLSIEISQPTPEAIDAFIELHTQRFGERGLFPPGPGGERSRRFVHRLAQLERESVDGGQLHVGIVRCGARLVFSMLAFDDGSTCFLYNAGMDPAASDVSPGITGTAEYLRDRLAAGRRRFDFLRGNEAYKYEWGARDEPIHRLLVLREAEAAA
jgi:CelD/BcsL family acetyltransferase involved in cellulose biosynthesis